ncbi:hypothetical protein MUK42_36926 [Musa troglodytarum]|uniref:Uncharacterized protein n=1 Tax=Musa troglodytarum TaxID=320322 RepID=A0A9E7G9N9_9LILI|nr:hypothetical protein MUK42_36926 [Musa troglodytarum]
MDSLVHALTCSADGWASDKKQDQLSVPSEIRNGFWAVMSQRKRYHQTRKKIPMSISSTSL